MPVRNFSDLNIKTFVEEVKVAYQNEGIGMRSRVRVRDNVVGDTADFPRAGALGAPLPKQLVDDVPTVETDWSKVVCTLQSRWLGHYVDPRADLVTNVDERRVVVQNLGFALARWQDDLIIGALNTSTNSRNSLSADDTFADETPFQLVLRGFGEDSVARVGSLFALVTWDTWTKLLRFQSFVNAELGGDPALTRAGVGAKMYFGFAVLPHERLPVSGSSRINLFWQRDACGLAVGAEPEIEMREVFHKDAILIRAFVRMGAVLIDHAGVIRRRVAA